MYTHKAAAPEMLRDYLELKGPKQQQTGETMAQTVAATAGFLLCMAMACSLLFIA